MRLSRKYSFSAMAFGAFMIASLPIMAAGDVEKGKAKAALCAACHGADGVSMSPDIPNLAGQKAGYLAKAIKDYKTGARKNPMMASVVPMVSDADIEHIAAYFASLK